VDRKDARRRQESVEGLSMTMVMYGNPTKSLFNEDTTCLIIHLILFVVSSTQRAEG
jgi:hypothetical protein